MTMTNEQLAADIKRVMYFLCQIVSVDSDATFDGLRQKTYYQMSDNGDPIYRADVEKKRLIEFSKDAKLATDIIRQLTDIVRLQHEALEHAAHWRPFGEAIARHIDGSACPVQVALALSAPLVKEV
jgi:hypothetical protein